MYCLLITYTTQNKFCISYKHVSISLIGEKTDTYIRSEQPFYLLTKTWKYDISVFGTAVTGGAQTEYSPKMRFDLLKV